MVIKLDSFARGQICSGTVTRIEPFGVFVKLPGEVEGFISVPELSWRPLRSVGEVVRVDQEVRTEVLDIDQARGQVRLSLKGLQDDPFPTVAALVGKVVVGPITKVAPFGVFVRIEDRVDGFEGLLPYAGWRAEASIGVAESPLTVGQLVRVMVDGVDLNHRRILLTPDEGSGEPSDT